MAFNPLRIEKEVELGGRTRTLVFTMGAIVEMERLLNRSIINELQGLAENQNAIRFDFLAAGLCAGLRAAGGNRAVTMQRVESWLPNDMNELGQLYAELLPSIAEVLGVASSDDDSGKPEDDLSNSEAPKKTEELQNAGPSV